MCPSECGFACVVCGGWRSTSNVNHSPSDDHWLARLTDQWAQGIPLSTAIQHWMTGMCHYVHLHGRWRSNTSLDSCTTIILPTELSPPPCCVLSCVVSLLYSMMPCALPPDSLGYSSGKHPEETGKEKDADQSGRQVRGTYRWLWSSTGRKAPDPSTVPFAPW